MQVGEVSSAMKSSTIVKRSPIHVRTVESARRYRRMKDFSHVNVRPDTVARDVTVRT